jgi:hypothetical protein
VNAFSRTEYGEVSNLEERQHQRSNAYTARRGVA